MKIIMRLGITSLLLGMVALACGGSGGQVDENAPAIKMMPDLEGYKLVEGQTVQGYIANLAEGGTLLAGQPELTALIAHIDQVADCYKEEGAVNLHIYSDKEFPLSSGIVVIVDRNRLTDPKTALRCIGGEISPFSNQLTLEPCSHYYTLAKDNNEFQIIYVGTTPDICHDFCTQLEGCTQH